MVKKQMAWKTKGMNQDLSVSAFNPEFSFENRNLRLSTNESNTLLSWVNERGTKLITISSMADRSGSPVTIDVDEEPVNDYTIHGYPIGTAVINHQLIVFTTQDSPKKDYIYSFTADGNHLKGVLLYEGNLGFDIKYPIETLVSYESDTIQKVYWTNGLNQPRVINVASDKEWTDTSFDFVTTFEGGDISVEKIIGGGMFNPGVIQYCFTYFNKNGQQSNVVDVSPIYYITHIDRGASPEEESVSNSFRITIDNIDTSFDYVRIYSIQRTSLNLDPIVKIVEDIKINGEDELAYTDSGTIGITLDPYELLYVGGKEITAYTMAEKDGTLFLGNIEEKRSPVDAIQQYIREEVEDDAIPPFVEFHVDSTKTIELDPNSSFYSNTFTLNQSQQEITTFKGGDTYRFGFQLQKKTGEWTEPIWIGDVQNEYYPSINGNTVSLPYAEATIPISELEAFAGLNVDDYIKIRPVTVFPSIVDRNVLCQGVVNPTVFNCKDRETNSPYAQASWFFRPYKEFSSTSSIDVKYNEIIADENGVVIESVSAGTAAATMDSSVSTAAADYDTVNVLVAEVQNSKIKDILHRGGINKTTSHSLFRKKLHDFDKGVIPLGSPSGTTTGCQLYVFLSSDAWYASGEVYSQDLYLEKNGGVNRTGSIYNKLGIAFPYIYYDHTGNPATYAFQFKTNDTTLYTIKFKNCSSDSLYYTGTDVGEYTNWKHLQVIYNEIQGSGATWEWPYDADTYESQSDCNNIFCCDHSIVTLNSPDIEFDTEVQSYSPDDLGLRIIGMVPIDANVSTHHILSSAMLETWHNRIDSSDLMLGEDPEYHVFGAGELQNSILHKQGDMLAGKRLLSDYLWNDVVVRQDSSETGGSDKIRTKGLTNYLIYPWHRTGSLNNDTRPEDAASSWLKKKQEATLLYSFNNIYTDILEYENLNSQFVFTENYQVTNYRLGKQLDSTDIEPNYYPNIDKILYTTSAYTVVSDPPISEFMYLHNVFSSKDGTIDDYGYDSLSPVSMKYKSTAHAVIAFSQIEEDIDATPTDVIPILPYLKTGAETSIGKFEYNDSADSTSFGYKPFWDSGESGHDYIFTQEGITHAAPSTGCFLWLAELYKKTPIENMFGGNSPIALRSNNWIIGGSEKTLDDTDPTLTWTVGDTYYQRYDCLKTYPFTKEDTNQVVEILSFMCETHVNLDGRYDRNRGQIDNTNMSPENFNLLNPVYNQSNNFFTYRKVESADEEITSSSYSNYITYSKTKESGSDVDLWTNITMGSVLDLDGARGEIRSLQRFNDQIIAFQDSGISQILYNENVQISSTAGVPIEIANSGKVQGKRYLSNTVGCSNKWSICQTPSGIYFMDSNEKSIYLFNGQLNNLSTAKGFNTWCKKSIPSSTEFWNSRDMFGYVSYYDKLNQDVLFVGRNETLAFSEKVGNFTSFYDYDDVPYFCSLDDIGLWIKYNIEEGFTEIHKHQAGEYCNFFGENKPYGMILVGNPEPLTDKVFTNLEFRATVTGEGVYRDMSTDPEIPHKEFTGEFYLPFDYLETWNEHQHGLATLSNKNGRRGMMHHTADKNAALKRKFRIWRCDIPRDNLYSESTFDFSFDTSFRGLVFKRGVNRMRNPWVYIKLLKKAAEDEVIESGGETEVIHHYLPKTEIHDMVMDYYN